MKDKLEQFITENRDSFNYFEPNDAVWDKVEKKLNKPKRIRFNYKTLLVRVAAVLIIFFSSYYFHSFMNNRKNNDKIALRDRIENDMIIVPELIETEAYYNGEVSAKLVELKQFTSNYPDVEKDVKYDLNELDSVYAELKNDLKDNVANDEVIEALIQNYRLKLKILEDLLEQLKQSQNQNTDKNEHQIQEL